MAAIGILCFFLVPTCLSIYILAFLASGWGKTQVGPSRSALQGWGSWSFAPLSLSLRGTLSSWGVLSWIWALPAWRIGWCRQMKLLFLPFYGVIFVPLCYWSTLTEFLSSPRAVLFMGSSPVVDLWERGCIRSSVSHPTMLVMSSWNLRQFCSISVAHACLSFCLKPLP